MKYMKTRMAGIAASMVLAACGGGGDGGTTGSATPASSSAEGFWVSGISGLLVTNTGEAWLISLTSPQYSLAKGQITASGSSVAGSFTTYVGTPPTFSVSGTVTNKSSMTLTATAAGVSPQTGTLSYSSDYDSTPSVAGLAGFYTISSGGSATISSSGTFTTGPLTSGCTASGQITADNSGKNFYRATVTYSGSSCAAAGLTAVGVMAWMNSNVLVGGGIAGNVGDAFTLTRSSAR